MDNNNKHGILTGITVLDLSRMLSGPYCTMMLADHGAEVIKVEDTTGDKSRSTGPFKLEDIHNEWAGYFVSLNRNKKSIQLDLKTSTGRNDFLALAQKANVVVENFRPGVMDRLNIGYNDLNQINNRIVYAAISGFGDPRSGKSPYFNWPSYDVVAQAMGGLMGLTGANRDNPTKVGPGIGDIFSGMMMSFGILAALRHVDATGQGQFVDLSMYDAMISLCERGVYQYDFNGVPPVPEGNGHPLIAPFGIFKTKDGHIALGIVDDNFWSKLVLIMDKPELKNNPNFATKAGRQKNAKQVNHLVEEWTLEKTKDDLVKLLGGEVPFGPVNSMADIFNDPHVKARKMIVDVPNYNPKYKPWRMAGNPIKFSNFPTPKLRTPPKLGADNKFYLKNKVLEPVSEIQKKRLRKAMGNFATGVTVVTTLQKDGSPRGFTANSFTSVSLDPPLLLVCLAKTAQSFDVFMSAAYFGINILSKDQKDISNLFSSQSSEKFASSDWVSGVNDIPIIKSCLSHFVCKTTKFVDAGDHVILIGEIIDYDMNIGSPLGYFGGEYFNIGVEDTLVEVAAKAGKTIIGAVLTMNQKILLVKEKSGGFGLPKSPVQTTNLESLKSLLQNHNLDMKVIFLYSVYFDKKLQTNMIFYYGTVEGEVGTQMEYFDIQNIPFELINSTSESKMLKRYVSESKHGSFGIYDGDEISGEVKKFTLKDRKGIVNDTRTTKNNNS